ncbi:hypothetical protein [Microbacterium foliorum]|uniref:hypothetical protein n=1 Tax=Microbacterium foliorum TaxID=104336 RepID=UPI00286AFC66|nr:hypothetical protein [Microbacterium foliorum]
MIIDNAPGWARRIIFTEISDDGGARFRYEFEDERFTILERWEVTPDGSLTYGLNSDDEPEISCKGDALLEMVANYIDGTGK